MSIRCLIAEDEPPILRTIKMMIEKCGSEFSVCFTAKNGAEALDCLEKAPVDIIFTDIRMPVMDGLALMEIVHRKYPDIFIVVLSGYQDFEYAKHALRNNAFDYLLKPITAEAISKTLIKLKTACHQRRRQEKTADLLANLHQVKRAGMETQSLETYLAALICAGPAPLYDNEDLLLPGAKFWYELDVPFLNADADWLFTGRTSAEKVLIRELADSGMIKETASEFFAAVSGAANVSITMLYFDRLIPFPDIGSTIRQLQRYLPGEQQVGISRICQLDAVSNPPKETFFPDVEKNDILRKQARLLADSLIMENSDFSENLCSCINILKEKESTYIYIYKYFDYVLSLYEKVKAPPRDVRILVYEAVYQALSYNDLRQNLLNLFESLQIKEAPKTPEFIGKVKKYLEESYRKPITGTDLSRQFGFVSSYISRIFRQNFGYSPAHYITMLRIDEAKRLLREQPGLLIKEVALLTGFKDQHHFSKTFKKEVGFWPTNYRG